jgi:hypothetical protein
MYCSILLTNLRERTSLFINRALISVNDTRLFRAVYDKQSANGHRRRVLPSDAVAAGGLQSRIGLRRRTKRWEAAQLQAILLLVQVDGQ